MAHDITERMVGKPSLGAVHLIWTGALIVAAAMYGSLSRAQSSGVASLAPPSPLVEVATIKLVKNPMPGRLQDRTEGRRLSARNVTLRDLLMLAYEVDPRQITGGPGWTATDLYDIDAIAAEGVQIDDQREEAIFKELLADRFHLTFHREQRVMPVYALIVAKSGPRLKAADPDAPPNGANCERLGVCSFKNEPLQHFARWMQLVMDKPVLDKTGLAGMFDFSLTWTPDESQFTSMGIHVTPPTDNPNAPLGLFTAIQEQLGLKLEPQKIPAEIIVIDHIERPSEN
jgi:uncharacterized protein (TIGR03435 family)